jgi:competence protein ComEA
VLAVVAASAAVLTAVGVWRERPVPEPPPPLAAVPSVTEPGPAVGGPARRPTGGGRLVVSVVGKVRHPGLVTVPEGARVADAIGKAGGPVRGADLSTVNLARRVTDGEQIAVGVPVAAGSADASAEPGQPLAEGDVGGKVDLNRATVQQLDALPGIGPVTARRILDWRAKHGRFASVDQLREIEGIGERRFNQLKNQVRV